MVNNRANYYYDFHHPLPLVELVLDLLGRGSDPTTPITETGAREWFSQPREGASGVTECLTVNFRLPLSVSEMSVDILRMPCVAEFWYQDRSNNWRPVLDRQRSPLRVAVSRSDTKSWHRFRSGCYPIVAKKVQIRVTRTPDPVTLNLAYPVGLRNTLIRRNVYERHDGGHFEDEVDVMGNVVSKHIRDWDAALAADDNYTTFWKSEPQPDPSAVVSLYLDVRGPDGNAQLIDKLYLDPVYTGQHLNIYHSSDMTSGTLALSPVTLPPVESTNVSWSLGSGLESTAESSRYSWRMAIGTQERRPAWVGVEWRPGFGSANADLATNPVLYAAGDPDEDDGPAAAPQLYYEPSGRRFVLQFVRRDADTGQVVLASGPHETGPISEEWSANDALRVVAGWRYPGGGTGVRIKVVDNRGRTIALLEDDDADVPDSVTLDGESGIRDFRGAVANMIVKLSDPDADADDFITSPTYYCDPDPVIPDDNGNRPSTSLDDAVYAAPFTARRAGSGGADRSAFEGKEWTPVWRDYVVQKGMLHLPRAVSTKFLKLEFTNLSEQPYPVYESGIEVRYRVFPVEAVQASTIGPRLYTGQGGFLGMGTFISMNGVKSVNWLDPGSVLEAIGSVLAPQTPPVVINTGVPYITDSLPNQGSQAVQQSRRIELASSYVYSRDVLQSYVLAADQYNTLIKSEGLQAVQPYVDVPWTEIEAANPGAVTKVRSVGTVPVRGTDWWIYPGQRLKVPASVMRKLTGTQTVTERRATLESRTRFSTTSVHRYEWRTVKRDAAVAYFAGLREVQPYVSTYVGGEDRPVIDFPTYHPGTWVVDGGEVQDDGTIIAPLPNVPAVVSSEFETQSDFSRIAVTFNDSGLVRSDSMWADPNTQKRYVESGNVVSSTTTTTADAPGARGWSPNEWAGYYLLTSDGRSALITGNGADDLTHEALDSPAIPGGVYWISATPDFNDSWRTGDVIDDNVALAPYVDTIPSGVPGGTWSDFTSTWSDQETVWGSTYGLVSVSVDPDRRFMGRRVLRFTRGAGTDGLEGQYGRAGLGVQQWTNFVPGSQFRIGCVIYRPATTTNKVVLTLRSSDGVRVHEERLDDVPAGRWHEHTTGFFDIPETLPHAGFEGGFAGWVTTGAPWSLEEDPALTRTGGRCARLATSAAVASSLQSVMVPTTTGTTVKASAWVRWAGAQTGQAEPPIRLRAVFYDNSESQVAAYDLDGGVTPGSADSGGWVPVSGRVAVPRGIEAAQVSLELVVEGTLGGGGTLWVDDFSVDVPYAPAQQYQVQLTLEGDQREEILVSDLYTEIAPARYFVQLGRRDGSPTDDPRPPVQWDPDPIEVTDLRYTGRGANVTRTEPANAFRIRAVLASNDAKLVGARIVPAYLK